MDNGERNSANDYYNNIVKAHEEASALHIPKQIRTKKGVPWENNEVLKKEKL